MYVSSMIYGVQKRLVSTSLCYYGIVTVKCLDALQALLPSKAVQLLHVVLLGRDEWSLAASQFARIRSPQSQESK